MASRGLLIQVLPVIIRILPTDSLCITRTAPRVMMPARPTVLQEADKRSHRWFPYGVSSGHRALIFSLLKNVIV